MSKAAGQSIDVSGKPASAPPRRSDGSAIHWLRQAVRPLASLKLTVALMFASMGLIFVGTLAQVDRGLWAVMEDYFRSVYVMVPVSMLLPGQAGDMLSESLPGLVFPWPGGATLGTLLLVNLLAAHAVRFTVAAKGTRLWLGIVVSLLGTVSIASAFLIPCVASWLATHGIVPLFAVGSLFFVPLMVGAWMIFGRRFGIVLIHASLILLLISEGVTAMTAQESQMPIYEGQSIAWSQDIRKHELALIQPADVDGHERVWVVRQHALERAEQTGETIDLSPNGLPLRITVKQYMTNSRLLFKRPGAPVALQATHGFAAERFFAEEINEAAGVTGTTVDVASAIVSFTDDQGNALGTFLVSGNLEDPSTPFVPLRQSFQLRDGTSIDTVLRFRRLYKPYTVELVDFRHDLYPGTNTPKNFSSDIVLLDPAQGVERAVHIKMNEPLRYAGETFFQANWIRGVDGGPDRGTVLQMVDNPGWTVPYIACIVGGLGLAAHFILSLVSYRSRVATSEKKRLTNAPPLGRSGPKGRGGGAADALLETHQPASNALKHWLLPACVALFASSYLLSGVGRSVQPRTIDGLRFHDAGQLAVSYGGRFKPIDSVARDTLLAISGKSTLNREGERVHATRWLLDAATSRPNPATGQPFAMHDQAFRIDHPELKRLIGVIDTSRKLFSVAQIEPHLPEIDLAAQEARNREDRDRSSFDRQVIELQNHVALYSQVASFDALHMVPPESARDRENHREDWRPLRQAMADTQAASEAKLALYDQMFTAYQQGNVEGFNAAVTALLTEQSQRFPDLALLAKIEQVFNHYGPFMRAMVLYVAAGLCVLVSWLAAPNLFLRSALVLLVLALIIHTLGLGTRVYLSGRPPVTNLYSSAVFIGWGVAILGLLIERFTKLGLGYLVAAISGVGTLLVARGLDDGDTMAVLQAVLDTNFWLATHVIIITLGYSAMFVAGLLGLFYLLGGAYTRVLAEPARERRLRGSIYGVTCFALLLSFVGTILGGIWADQSWGRFWGWDPKENGAMMIVLWGAILLHARWGKLIEGRGIAALAVLGNVVTCWSWFGVNMLGAGLHSYGFIDSAAFWLIAFVVTQIAIASVALIPRNAWASFAPVRVRD